jgi:hypothetical protein
MRKSIYVIPMLIILLTSCNFPLSGSTDTSGVVATRVAQTLAAANPGTVQTPHDDATIIYVTATESVLATVTPSITPTVTPMADPKLTLGSPAYTDSLNHGSYWDLETTYTDDATKMYLENSHMVLSTTKTYSTNRWRLTYPSVKDYYLEGTFKTVTCTGNDTYGLVMRAPNYNDGNGYYFGVNCGGEYHFSVYSSSKEVTLVDWTADSHILSGSGKENRLGVLLKDKHISLYINDNLVKELDDSSINASGYFGVFIRSYDNANITVYLDQINQWNLP